MSYIPAPAGVVHQYAGSTAPSGWLLCDGSAVSRTTYAALFAAISTTYGSGDGSTTFNLPNFKGRFALGKQAAGTGSSLGETGGALDHTHTGAAHTHTISSDGSHSHTVASHTHTVTDHVHGGTGHTHGISSDGSHSHGGSTSSAVGGLVDTPVGSGGGVVSDGAHDHNISSDGSHSHGGATGAGGDVNSQGIVGGAPASGAATPGTDSQGAHTHGGATGSTTPGATGTANPAYLTLNYIIKT